MGLFSHLCGTWTVLAQCSATVVQLHRDFGSLYKKRYSKFLVLLRQKSGTAAGSGGLRYTKMVCGVRCLV